MWREVPGSASEQSPSLRGDCLHSTLRGRRVHRPAFGAGRNALLAATRDFVKTIMSVEAQEDE